MKKALVIISLIFVGFSATAGDTDKKSKSKTITCSYTGEVLDAENAEALTGATVRLVEIDQEVFADFDGEFTFENIPAGTYTLEISFVSYETKVVEGVTIDGGAKSKRFLL